MYSRRLGAFVSYSFSFVILVIVIFSALRWLQLPAGQLIDWIIGAVSSWWLLVITTVPWNVHFEAKATVAEAQQSEAVGIKCDATQIKYAGSIARRSLVLAVSLHLLSAMALFALSATHITPIGYVGSIAALLLTGLRPAISAYEYLCQRLLAIRHQVKYPRDDVLDLKEQVTTLRQKLSSVEEQIDPSLANSWAHQQNRKIAALETNIHSLTKALNDLRDHNDRDHERLARESENAIAHLSADSQFLNHVSEIIRFIKTA